ncbi:VOC family protein [Streptomyces sp. NPDC101181]|uniref:VOC family protein n=1 Tax=Streptomyces sp. NPDC101181 TaxID=3366125 RepID=UPI00380C377B
MTGSDPRTAPAAAPLTGPAAPCWVTLMTRDLGAAQRFYGQVLGWSFRPGRLGEEFSVARRGDVPVAGVVGVSSAYKVAVAWMPYFAVADADRAAARVRERSGTVAVGPLTVGAGRGVLASDRDGAAFGLWEHADSSASAPAPAGHAHTWLRLRTRNAFDAAIFYGEVLDWASGHPGSCDVAYEGEEVIVRCQGRPLARISSGAVEAAADPLVRPHWQVQFPVTDLPGTVAAAGRHGGEPVEERAVLGGTEVTLRDPDGALFTVTDVRTPVGSPTP